MLFHTIVELKSVQRDKKCMKEENKWKTESNKLQFWHFTIEGLFTSHSRSTFATLQLLLRDEMYMFASVFFTSTFYTHPVCQLQSQPPQPLIILVLLLNCFPNELLDSPPDWFCLDPYAIRQWQLPRLVSQRAFNWIKLSIAIGTHEATLGWLLYRHSGETLRNTDDASPNMCKQKQNIENRMDVMNAGERVLLSSSFVHSISEIFWVINHSEVSHIVFSFVFSTFSFIFLSSTFNTFTTLCSSFMPSCGVDKVIHDTTIYVCFDGKCSFIHTTK